MKNIINKTLVMLSAVLLFATSCTKEDVETVQYLEVNASNIHGNWQLETINGTAVKDGSFFYINFNRSGQKFKIWDGMRTVPSSYDYSEGTFDFFTKPELGTYIRGIDSVKEEWGDLYVIKNLTKNSMTWVGVNDPTFIQTFIRVSKIPFVK